MSELPKELENEEVGPSPEGSLPVLEDVAMPMEPIPAEALFDEASAALKSFKDNMTTFVKMLEDYQGSRKQVARAWMNSALNPINDGPLTWSYPAEQDLFNLYTEIEGTKFILMVHGLKDAGILTLHKPLMQSTAATQSELDLRNQMKELTGGETIDLGTRELPLESTENKEMV